MKAAIFTETDAIYARGVGIDLEDSAKLRALRAERDGAFEIADRMQERLQQAYAQRDRYYRRWVWTFGLFLVYIAAIAGVFVWRGI